MSKFSEHLRNLINRSGGSISAISRSIGAERTSIHKALSDDRVLPYKVVQNLARHFNLSLGFITYYFKPDNSELLNMKICFSVLRRMKNRAESLLLITFYPILLCLHI